jgi:hypothetical protein
MKLRIIYIRQILLAALLILCSQNRIYSQGTDITRGTQNHFFIGVTISPAQTSINNIGTLSVSKLTSGKKTSFFTSVDLGFYSKFVVISTGIGYSSYVSDITLDTYDNEFDTTDSESESYTRQITGKNIIENQKISFLNIPLVFTFQIPFNTSFGMYLQTGVNFSLPMKKSYTSTGTFTYTGYYKAYNVSITGVTYEGFLQDKVNTIAGKELAIKSFDPELVFSAGFYVSMHDKTQISFGVLYNRMLSNISGYSSKSTFQLSSKPDQTRSMMEGSSKVTAHSLGLKVSLRIFL